MAKTNLHFFAFLWACPQFVPLFIDNFVDINASKQVYEPCFFQFNRRVVPP